MFCPQLQSRQLFDQTFDMAEIFWLIFSFMLIEFFLFIWKNSAFRNWWIYLILQIIFKKSLNRFLCGIRVWISPKKFSMKNLDKFNLAQTKFCSLQRFQTVIPSEAVDHFKLIKTLFSSHEHGETLFRWINLFRVSYQHHNSCFLEVPGKVGLALIRYLSKAFQSFLIVFEQVDHHFERLDDAKEELLNIVIASLGVHSSRVPQDFAPAHRVNFIK